MKFLVFRRYSQFRNFRKRVRYKQIPQDLKETLSNFPKKKLLQTSSKLKETRRIMLEKWLRSVISFTECQQALLTFLSIPEPIIQIVLERNYCKLNESEKAVANLIKRINKIDKKGTFYLKAFSDSFFFNNEQNISSITTSILLKNLIPLCSNPATACKAIDILYKLLHIESYRYSDYIKQSLFNNIELLQKIQIEKHILNCYQSQTGMQGYTIANIVKEYFDRNGMSQYFRYFLNYNEEAFDKFCIREEGKTRPDTIVLKASLREWHWLNTDNYSGGLKIAVRKTEEYLEVKGEIFIKASIKAVGDYIKYPEKRKEWDPYMNDMKIIRKIEDQRYLVWYSLKKDKKSTLDLSLECHVIDSADHLLITFSSAASDSISCINDTSKVGCTQSYYEIQSVGIKVRRVSSNAEELDSDDELDSEDESISSCQSNFSSSLIVEERKMSKVNLFLKMKPEMARCFVGDLSEETSILKESFESLKNLVEQPILSEYFIN